MEDNVSLDDRMSFIKVWNCRFGESSNGTITLDMSSLIRGGSLIDDKNWKTPTTGPFAATARYQKTPHGVLVQGSDQKISLMTESVAATLGMV